MYDMHRHLGGSIPTSFIWEIINELGLHHLAESHDDVVAQMTFAPYEQRGFYRFLDKFRLLDQIRWTEDLIARSIQACCTRIAIEGITHCWMDFSINKYMCYLNWSEREAIQFIHDRFEEYAPGVVGLVLSLKYESPRTSQKKYAALINDPVVAPLLTGIDLVGDEAYFDAEFYRPIFVDWRRAKKMTRAHVGESQSAENIMDAIVILGVTNVAHGLKIIDHVDIIKAARDHGVTFDMGVTSTYLTNVVTSGTHPARMIFDLGLDMTFGTDDPIQCSTTIGGEHDLVCRDLLFKPEEIAKTQEVANRNFWKYH